jgi:ribosomal protein L36
MLSAIRYSTSSPKQPRSPASSSYSKQRTFLLDSDVSSATVSIFTSSDISSRCREHISLSSAESISGTDKPFREGTVVIYNSNKRHSQKRIILSSSGQATAASCNKLVRRKSAFASTKVSHFSHFQGNASSLFTKAVTPERTSCISSIRLLGDLRASGKYLMFLKQILYRILPCYHLP